MSWQRQHQDPGSLILVPVLYTSLSPRRGVQEVYKTECCEDEGQMTYHVLAQGSPLAGLRDCLPEYSSGCGFLVPETLSVV